MNTASKIALVTGATRGIGRETVRQLAEAGVHVLLAGRDLDRATAAAAALKGEGLPVEAIALDVTDPASIAAAAKEVGAPTVLLGGGVVANSRLRERLAAAGEEAGIEVLFPSMELCTDNAAMIACVGAARWARGERSSLDIGADPQRRLTA